MKLRSTVLLLAFASFTLAASASKPSNKFKVIHTSDGKTIGNASYSIEQTKTGYKLNTSFDVTLARTTAAQPSGKGDTPPAPPLEVQSSASYKLNPDGSFVSGSSENALTQTSIEIQPNKARTSITVGERVGTNYNSQPIPVSDTDFFVIPDYDPGAIQVLMTSALAHPHSNNEYYLLIPADPEVGQRNSAGNILLDPDPDVTGTLDGKPITLKHFSIDFSTVKDEIYTDATGTLMEAIIGPVGVTFIRDKFALNPAS